ncbi:VWFA and cache domain-containing protein 1 isoform X3 [Magallana gigas]|uniref:VWFA and cache domain-containing protein 1 isoform X3 n=1 Tax=Magallana gigas TaxID=29159 RepID=UPI0033417CA4
MRSLEFIQHEIPPYILGKDFDMATIKVLVLACLVSPSLAKINADILAGELNRVMEDIGYKELQDHFNRLEYTTFPIDYSTVTQKVADSITAKFREMEEALHLLRTNIEQDFLSFSSKRTTRECCENVEYKYVNRFRAKVDFDSMCVTTSGISSRQKKYPTKNGILNTMKSNHKKNPSLLWQYVGFENGILINYPATKLSHCSSYDPRFRPFYKEGLSPMPKEVVIAVDASKSMTGVRFQKAKDAVHRVLESLGSTDRIGIVMFNEKAYRPEKDVQPCYGRNLAVVTQKTKAVLRSFVNSQTTKGNTNYSLAFEAAFNYFMSSGNTITASDKVILFVSDGDNLDGDNALTVIRDRNEQLGNSVVIHTFAIGSLSDSAESLLRNISKQTKNNDDHGATQTGRYQRVTNLNHLPEAVGSFYSYSNNAISPKPIFTKPYVDFFSNIGLIVSMCLPCTSNSNFIGVVCTDIKLKDLVEDTTYLQQGEDTYSFVIDGTGRTLIHPLLPDPRDSNANEYDVDDIDNFETGGNVKEVIESMKLGHAGSKEINTTVAQVRGNLLMEGDKRTRMRVIYQWQQIKETNFSLCIVFPKYSVNRILQDLPPSHTAFLYHRWDIASWPGEKCKQFARYATTESSVVKLTPEAFVDPTVYLDTAETKSSVKMMIDFISGDRSTNPELKIAALNSILATEKIDSIWKNNQRKTHFILWRFLATEAGVVRIYPGVKLQQSYDHKLREWYRRTIANCNINVISAPYNDHWGAGKVISISRTIHIKRCMVIDNSGFLVMHPSFVESKGLYFEDRSFHITHLEGTIARSLIKENIMFKQPCLSVESQKEQMTYRVVLTFFNLNGLDKMNSEGYELRPIRNTNLFFILKIKKNIKDDQCCSAKNSEKSPNVVRCTSAPCDCLCYRQVNYNECENKYNATEKHIPCSAALPVLTTNPIKEDYLITNLPSCFDSDCSCKDNELDCYNISGCSWCSVSMSGDLLENPFCDSQEACPVQVCHSKNCEQKCDAFDDLGKSKSSTAVIIVVCILLILLSSLILFLICLRRYKQKLNKKHNEAYLDPAMDNYQEVVRYNGNRAHIDDGHQEQKAQVGRRLPGHPPVENETDGVIYTVSNSVVPDTGIS